jgi:hypothetical protein
MRICSSSRGWKCSAVVLAVPLLCASVSGAAGRSIPPSAHARSNAILNDTRPPSAPTDLTARGFGATAVFLRWRPARDNLRLAGYDVFDRGIRVGRRASTTFVARDLACGSTYAVGVEAFDAAENHSPRPSVTVTTAPCSTSSPPPPAHAIADPQAPHEPARNRRNLAGLGYNVYQGSANIHDVRIHDTGDSAILLHGDEANGVVRRVEISRVENGVGWATHGIYAKAPGGLFEDVRVDNTNGVASSGITLRMRNQTLRRIWIGGGFNHPLTYYEHDGEGGQILVEDAELHCTSRDMCIWGDDSNDPPSPGLKQQFTFRRVHVFGPAGSKFVDFENYVGPGIVFQSCFMNGHPLNAADIGSHIPLDKVTIQP